MEREGLNEEKANTLLRSHSKRPCGSSVERRNPRSRLMHTGAQKRRADNSRGAWDVAISEQPRALFKDMI
jgi:hypothetical protein